MRKFFTQLISTMLLGTLVLLTPYGLWAQGGEAQTTLATVADDTSVCYNGSNLYGLKILVKDFVKIEELDLQLDYDASVFNYVDFDVERTELETGTGLNVTDSPEGTLNLTWSNAGNPTDIQPNNDTTHIVTLWFNIDNYPYNTSYEYTSAFVWDVDNSSYSYAASGDQDVFTTSWLNGSLTVSVIEEFRNIIITPDDAVCYNSNVNVTVEPAGYEYSFNGDSYTSNNVGNASEGENWVRLRDENGCVSLRETFTITAPEPVVFDTVIEDARCYGGNGEIQFINVTGGTPEYSYIVVPQDKVDDVIQAWDNGTLDLSTYTFSTEQILRKAGTYSVAVQDANGCVELFEVDGTADTTSVWEDVTINEPTPLGASVTAESNISCYDGADGSITVTMGNGGTPWDGTFYKVMISGSTELDSVDTGASITFDELEAGDYTISVMDNSCTQTLEVTLTQPYQALFSVDYEDVDCVDTPDGQIWITNVWWMDPAGNDTVTSLTGWTFEVFNPEGTSEGSAAVDGGVVAGLSPDYYSVVVTDPNGCTYEYSNSDGSGNTVPVMSPELIQFQTIVTDVECKGSATGTITITNLSGAANYEFSLDGAAWQDTSLTYEDLTAGTYTVSVQDADNAEACVISKNVSVMEPEVALAMTVTNTVPPTCDGGNDGNAYANAAGGWPFHDANGDPYYEYSLDGSPYWVTNPVFAVTEGDHTLTVRDSLGCVVDVNFPIENLDATVFTASVPENPIYCYDSTTVVNISFVTETNDFTDDQYEFYVSTSSDMAGMELFMPGWATTPDELGAGTYYFQAKDPNGCWSTVEELEILQNEELEIVEWSKENASCAEYWDGSITIKVTGGSPFLDGTRYKYALKNNKEVFSNPDATINWQPFSNDDPANDSTTTIQTLKGTYFLGVTDSCGSIVISDTIVIEGYESIEIDKNVIELQSVTCYGDEDGYIDMAGAVTGGNEEYLYTLYESDGVTVVDGTDEEQTDAMFDGLAAGTYIVEVTDTSDPACPGDQATVIVPTPDILAVDYDTVHVSCYGEEDGEISIAISGGTGGNYGLNGYNPTSYDEDGKKYRVVINNTDSEGTSYGSYTYADGVDAKTFQVAAGEYVINIYDANGCQLGPDTITIEQPDMWDVTTEITKPTDCGLSDGKIEVTVNGGGWTGLPLQFQINEDGWVNQTDSVYTFTGIEFGADTVYVRVDPAAVAAAEDSINPGACNYSEIVTISEPMPFEYDVDIVDVSCYGGADGQFIISNVTGGSGSYQFQLVSSENPTIDSDMWLPLDAGGVDSFATEFTFDTLAYGHYTLYIRDSEYYTLSACQIPESWEINQPDSLEITETSWIKDVTCNGGADGSFEIMVEGGTPPYKYAATESNWKGEPTAELPYINKPDPEVDSLWQDEPVFTGVGAGTYVAWVIDANGCWIGGAIRPNGNVVDQHRVVIDEPVMIVSADTVVTDATCYGEANGSIVLNSVTGGNGVPFTYEVTGTMYDGTDTTYVFDDAEYDGVTDVLTGLYASMDDTSNYVGPEDMYFIYAIDAGGCRQLVDSTYITQPEEFIIDLVVVEDAFICANDLAGIVDIITVSGGTGDAVYQIYRDGVLVRNWTSNATHTLEAGHTYKVVAMDENGCESEVERYIESPEPITFDVIRTTCYGDEFASARIEVQGEADRQFRVIYVETENDIPVVSDTTEWFTSEININTFVYDGENADDVHYEMIVEDNFGCKSEIGVFTFDPVQTQLTLTTEVDGNMITASAIGGKVDSSSDYEFAIETVDYTGSMDSMMWSNETMFTVDSFATWVVYVRDLNRCWTSDTIESIGFSTMTVAEVQGDGDVSPVENTIVGVTGTVTAVVEGEGFFMQDANGAGNGIWVEYATTGDVTIDAGVQVVGTVAEVESVTTILADEVTDAAAPVVVVADTLASPSAAIDEMYESVLVIVEGAWGTEANEEGQWEIYYETNDSVMVNDWIYAYTPTAGNVYHVTGVVNGKADAYMLEPRMESDVVDVTATTPVDPEIELVEFKVYPNPFNDHIKIDNNDKLTRVVISNIAGQRVIDLEYPSNEIRTDRLVSGVYVVSMFTEDGLVKTERMIKR